MTQDFNMDFLLQRKAAPEVATVTLLGVKYPLLGVNVVEDFLITLGTMDEFVEIQLATQESIGERTLLVAEQLKQARDMVHGCIRRLVPTLPLEVLREHFATRETATELFFHLQGIVKESAPDGVKKNSSGRSTPNPKRQQKRRAPKNQSHS